IEFSTRSGAIVRDFNQYGRDGAGWRTDVSLSQPMDGSTLTVLTVQLLAGGATVTPIEVTYTDQPDEGGGYAYRLSILAATQLDHVVLGADVRAADGTPMPGAPVTVTLR